MKKILTVLTVLTLGLFTASNVYAVTPNFDVPKLPKSTICHRPDNNPLNAQTLNLPLPEAIAHLVNHEHDGYGECPQVEVDNLQLTSVCSDNPEQTRGWRVRNTNDFEVEFTWYLVGTDKQGTLTAPKSGDGVVKYEGQTEKDYMFFETSVVNPNGPNTVKIKWEGGETVKASGGQQCEQPEPTPEPTPQPTPVATPEPAPSEPQAPVCPDQSPLLVPTNPHVVRNGTTATVNAFIPEGDHVNIYYRENSSSNWTHALRDVPVTGGFLSVDINDLDANLGYTFGIQASNTCAGGETVMAVIIDPPATGQTFTLSFWEWL